MWNYEKRLQYPVNIKTPNAKIAQIIMSQYGGPDGKREIVFRRQPFHGGTVAFVLDMYDKRLYNSMTCVRTERSFFFSNF